MKPVAELIAVPGKSFPALVFADGFRDLPAGTKLYAGTADATVDEIEGLITDAAIEYANGWAKDFRAVAIAVLNAAREEK